MQEERLLIETNSLVSFMLPSVLLLVKVLLIVIFVVLGIRLGGWILLVAVVLLILRLSTLLRLLMLSVGLVLVAMQFVLPLFGVSSVPRRVNVQLARTLFVSTERSVVLHFSPLWLYSLAKLGLVLVPLLSFLPSR